MKTDNTDEFYSDLDKGNAVIHQQGVNNIMLAITSKITNSVLAGEDASKIVELMQLLKDLKTDSKTLT